MNARRGVSAADDAPPEAQFEAARLALAAGDGATAGRTLMALRRIPELNQAAAWVSASLLAPRAETRQLAIDLLADLVQQEHQTPPSHLLRALAARSLEAAHAQGVSLALKRAAISTFTEADRVSIAALSGAEPEAEALTALTEEQSTRPLAAAAYAHLGEVELAAQQAPSEVAEQRLARAFRSAERLRGALEPSLTRELASAADHPSAALTRLLEVQRHIEQGNRAGAAEALAGLATLDAPIERQLVVALAHELAEESSAARAAYQRAHDQAPAWEAPTRLLLEHSASHRVADLFQSTAEAAGDPTRQALLLTEAALRVQADAPQLSEQLLERAHESDPTLPFSYRAGEYGARLTGDVPGLTRWLERRRDAATCDIERAFDQVREALLSADEDLEGAAELLAEAVQARPHDVGLRELSERMSKDRAAERGAWREAAAAQAPPAVRARLLLEAALAYERDGDREAAARAAREAAAAEGGAYAEIVRERTAPGTEQAADLAELLLAQTKTATGAVACELYERLSEIDRARGDSSSALLWHSAILEELPQHLPALRQLEHAYLAARREDDLVGVERTLASALPSATGLAHATLALRLAKKVDEWLAAKDIVYQTNHPSPRPYWLLRQLAAYTQATGDDERALPVLKELAAVAEADLDAATLYVRAAEAAARLGQREDAIALLDQATERMPEHLVALTTRADVLEASGDAERAAEALEAAARVSAVARHQLEAWYQAGVLWLDRAANPARARAALGHAAQIDVTHADVFDRLRSLYVEDGDATSLASLLELRLSRTSDPDERVALEVTRAKALADIGDPAAARGALVAALDANPEHVDALAAFAELCTTEQDWPEAEQAWIRLARHVPDAARQAEIYRQLGGIYEASIPNPERAEVAYREVLKREPSDIPAREALVRVYSASGSGERALTVQNELLSQASSPDEQRDRTIALAVIHEQVLGDARQAENILEQLRKAAPTDPEVLRGLAALYQRTGESRTLSMLLDRTASDARRALGTGRFELSFFELLGVVAELRGDADAQSVTLATLSALTAGEPVAVRGVGAAAGNRALDDALAPDLLTLPLRAFIAKTGAVMDAAYPMDTRLLKAQPLPMEAEALRQNLMQLASAFGIGELSVLVAPGQGFTVTPVSSTPPQILIGKELLEAGDDASLYFLVFRALKLIQGRASALARVAPIDLWPTFAAMLGLFAQNFRPQGADAKRFAVATGRLRAALPKQLDEDLPVLALEVIGAIGNRASQLATALHEWGNRTALLAIGDPRAALRALHGGPLLEDEAERMKWIGRSEARDLVIFSVSEKYGQARTASGA